LEFDYSIVEILRKIEWFKNCEKDSLVSKYQINYVRDIKSVNKHCLSTRWNNLRLERRGDLTAFLSVKRIEKYNLWNSFALKLRDEIMPEFKVIIEERWKEKYQLENEITNTVCKDISAAIMIYQFREYFIEPFYDEIICIYEQGYLPCGWKGTYPEGKIIIF
jgi:hypothetical protein